MNRITVHAASSKLNPYNISIEITDSVSPAMLHTTAKLLEGLGCTDIRDLTINTGNDPINEGDYQ